MSKYLFLLSLLSLSSCSLFVVNNFKVIGVDDEPITSENQDKDKLPEIVTMEDTIIKAMTWTTLRLIKSWDGNNYYALVGSDKNTNPYQGDTPITESLPILCIKKDNLPKPDFVVSHKTPGGADRSSWSGGYIGITPPVQGITLTSVNIANNICVETFGEGYHIAEFHDGEEANAGWDFWGKLLNPNLTLRDRFWVSINDQYSNPWSHFQQ